MTNLSGWPGTEWVARKRDFEHSRPRKTKISGHLTHLSVGRTLGRTGIDKTSKFGGGTQICEEGHHLAGAGMSKEVQRIWKSDQMQQAAGLQMTWHQ